MDKKPFFSPLYSRTAILLYVSLALNFSQWCGVLVNKNEMLINISPEIVEMYLTQQDDNSLIDAVDRKLGKAKTVELQE